MILSRGARKCLDLMRWYAARYEDVYPFQKTIAKRLGVKERQLRNYFLELKIAGLLEIRKSGPRSAIYHVVTEENCRSSAGQIAGQLPVFSSASISELSNVSENTDQSTDEPTDLYAQAQTETLRRHLSAAGFAHLAERIVREATARGVSLFLIAARIERAFRSASRKESTKPRTDGWIWRVSGLAGTASGRQGHGAQRDVATGSQHPSETPCRPLAEEDRVSVSGEVAVVLDPPKIPAQSDEWLYGFMAETQRVARSKLIGRRV